MGGAEHQGKSSVLRFYLHKMMGLAASRSKRRGPFTLIFPSNFITRPAPQVPAPTPREQGASPIIKPASRCKLKDDRGQRAFFPRNFPAAGFRNARTDPSALAVRMRITPSARLRHLLPSVIDLRSPISRG